MSKRTEREKVLQMRNHEMMDEDGVGGWHDLPMRDIELERILLADADVQPPYSVSQAVLERIRAEGVQGRLIVERRRRGFLIFEGHDDYAAIKALVDENAACFDARTGMTGPAREVYRTIPCSIGYFCENANEECTGPNPNWQPTHLDFDRDDVHLRLPAGSRLPALNVTPMAEQIADAIRNRLLDERLKWAGGTTVRVLVRKAIPTRSAGASTLAARRRRLRVALARLLTPFGWRMTKANLFVKVEEENTPISTH